MLQLALIFNKLSLRRKYLILKDCERLREVIQTMQRLPKARFAPALLIIAWANEEDLGETSDFDEMVIIMCRVRDSLVEHAFSL